MLKFFKVSSKTQVFPKTQVSIKTKQVAQKSENNIYTCLKRFMIFSQFLGILPQENVTDGNEIMHFSWKSVRTAYCLCYIALLILAQIVCTVDGIRRGFTISSIASQVFYGGSLSSMVLFLFLAKDWARFIRKWCAVEKIMNPKYGYPVNIDRKVTIFVIIYMVVGFGDHILSVCNRFFRLKYRHGKNYTAEFYYRETLPPFFRVFPYNIAAGIYTSIITTHANLTWVFLDLFIVLMSLLIATRFRQVSTLLAKECTKSKPLEFWRGIREDYDRLCNLCKDLDDRISKLVMLSYFLNLFFLLIQLFHSIQPNINNLLGKIYFICSFIYLFFKTGSVSMYAAWINDESKVPANLITCIPSECYNIEMKRLLLQINFDLTCLTGCKMFRVTRSIVLSVASAIVTYELVLIQFNNVALMASNNTDTESDADLANSDTST